MGVPPSAERGKIDIRRMRRGGGVTNMPAADVFFWGGGERIGRVASLATVSALAERYFLSFFLLFWMQFRGKAANTQTTKGTNHFVTFVSSGGEGGNPKHANVSVPAFLLLLRNATLFQSTMRRRRFQSDSSSFTPFIPHLLEVYEQYYST